MEVSGGFFGGVTFQFHEGLNTILGGKGVGKSLVVEFLRFVLCQPSDVKDLVSDSESKLAKQLGRGGTVAIECRMPSGSTYRVTRTFDGVSNPVATVDVATGEPYDGDVSKLIPILAYSQNEVVDISRDSNVQLSLIDRLIDIGPHRRALESIRERLANNVNEHIQALTARDRVAQLKYEIVTLAAKVKELDGLLKHEMFAQKRTWDRRRAAFGQIDQVARDINDTVKESVAVLTSATIPDLPDEDSTERELQRFRSEVAGAVARLKEDVSGALSAFDTTAVGARASRAEWESKRTIWVEEFRKFLQNAGGEQEALSAEREKVAGDIAELGKELQGNEAKAGKFDSLKAEREGLLDEFYAAKQALFDARDPVYGHLTVRSEGRLQLVLKQNLNRSSYLDELEQLFRGLNIQTQYRDALVRRMMPRDFADAVISRDCQRLQTQGGLTETGSQRVVESLGSNQDLLGRVLLLPSEQAPEDTPEIPIKRMTVLIIPSASCLLVKNVPR